MKSFYLVGILMCVAWLAAGQVADFRSIDFSKADSVAHHYRGHTLTKPGLLAITLTHALPTDVEKFRAIYRWVCENIAYDRKLYIRNEQQRKKLKNPDALQQWYKQMNPKLFETLVQKRMTVCTGYAYLVRELAVLAGLQCEMIEGYGRNITANVGGGGVANHQWNTVKLNGKWYLCDATWSAGYWATQLNLFVPDYNDGYFLAHPEVFVRNHYPLDTAWTLLPRPPTLQQFLNRPLIYGRLVEVGTKRLYPDTFTLTVARGDTVVFRFDETKEDPPEHIALLVKEREVATYHQPKRDTSSLYTLRYHFPSRGTYAVHISRDQNFLASYSVVVK